MRYLYNELIKIYDNVIIVNLNELVVKKDNKEIYIDFYERTCTYTNTFKIFTRDIKTLEVDQKTFYNGTLEEKVNDILLYLEGV